MPTSIFCNDDDDDDDWKRHANRAVVKCRCADLRMFQRVKCGCGCG